MGLEPWEEGDGNLVRDSNLGRKGAETNAAFRTGRENREYPQIAYQKKLNYYR